MVAPPTFLAANYFIMGFIMGYAYLYLRSILVPIMVHQANNILASISSSWFNQPFPWNFVAFALPFFAFFNAAFVFGYELLQYYKKVVAAPECWMCGRTESKIRRSFPDIKNILENYSVEGGAVKISFVCRRLISAVSEKKNEEG